MPPAVTVRTLRCALNLASHARPSVLASLQLYDPGRTDPVWKIEMNETPFGILPQLSPVETMTYAAACTAAVNM